MKSAAANIAHALMCLLVALYTAMLAVLMRRDTMPLPPFFLIAACVFLLGMLLSRRLGNMGFSLSAQPAPADRRVFFAAAGFCLLVQLTYLIGFYPGGFSSDNVYQWRQIVGDAGLSDWHPALHTLTLALLARYALIASEQNRLLAESRVRLAESRIAITMSQIQPHFLYNALGSISVLCDINPVSAREATVHFAEYLRMNMDSMKQRTPIPFQTELNHIETYIWLEKMRFGEKLQVIFDIKARDFQVPALSVQPIVENAVKHGICRKEGGGSLWITTWESEQAYHIVVQDDGIGFETEQVLQFNDGKLHIGIKNVRERLAMMVDGELQISSKPSQGTVAKISIPK